MKAKKTAPKKRKKSRVSGVKKRRKSRVGNAGGVDMTAILLTIGGAVGASLIDKVIPDGIDKKLIAGGKIVVGFALPFLAKDQKTKTMLTNIGHGFLAVGTIDILKELNVLSGTEDGNDLFIQMSGTENILAGGNDLNVLTGEESILAGEIEDLSVINGDDDDDDDDM